MKIAMAVLAIVVLLLPAAEHPAVPIKRRSLLPGRRSRSVIPKRPPGESGLVLTHGAAYDAAS
jgi:hypothetical protein